MDPQIADVDWKMMLALGAGAGVLGGMFGIGGGLVIVPVLAIACGFSMKTAIGTSSFALLFPAGILGVLQYYQRDQVVPKAGVWIALGLFLGAIVGAYLTGVIPSHMMKKVYGAFLVIIGVYYLFFSGSGK